MQADVARAGAALPGLARAGDALAAGEAVVVPNPPPMTYGLVATTAERINAVKHRSPSQSVAVSLHNRTEWLRVSRCLDVPATALDGVVAMLGRQLTLLLPLRVETPYRRWLRPAVRAGRLSAFNGRWAPTAALWERFPQLYGSSANPTGRPPATSADTARDYFGSACVVVDGGKLAAASGPTAASTVVAVDRCGRLRLHRPGADDLRWTARPNTYLSWLSDRVGLPVDPSVGDPG